MKRNILEFAAVAAFYLVCKSSKYSFRLTCHDPHVVGHSLTKSTEAEEEEPSSGINLTGNDNCILLILFLIIVFKMASVLLSANESSMDGSSFWSGCP